ncbi:MAG: hypothetical protein ACOVP1_06390 [Bacteroidia bacterium]
MNKLLPFIQGPVSRWIFFILLLLALVYQLKKNNPYPTGDALEYSLVTEALFQHHSPDIESSDVLNFKSATIKNRAWEELGKHEWYNTFQDSIHAFKNGSDALLKKDFHGISGNENRKIYSIHFISYSIFALPFRILFDKIEVEPLKAFIALNFSLLLLVVLYLLFFYQTENKFRIPLSILFICSPFSWYISWVHADYFIAALSFLSILLFVDKRWYLSILVMSLAATQNQTFVLICMAMSLVYLHRNNYQFKAFLYLLLPGIICILHPIYNQLLFNEWSLITFFKYTDIKNISLNRFYSFFFDLNQGMLIGFPASMALGAFFYLRDKNKAKNFLTTHSFLLVVVLLSIIPCLSFNSWNLGQAVINRYAIWFGALLFAYVLIHHQQFTFIIWTLLFLQMSYVGYIIKKKGFFIPEWDSEEIKPHVAWIWNKAPSLYNPDPKIFYERTQKKWLDLLNPNGFPAYYTNPNNGEITKVLVHQNHPESLWYPGADSSEATVIMKQLDFDTYGFAYYHPKK